jgi:hypothetical protein
MDAQQTKDLLRMQAAGQPDGPGEEAAQPGPQSCLETYTVMAPSGWTGPSYQARDSDEAAAQAETAGYPIVDVQDFTLVTPDEPPYDLTELQRAFPWPSRPEV